MTVVLSKNAMLEVADFSLIFSLRNVITLTRPRISRTLKIKLKWGLYIFDGMSHRVFEMARMATVLGSRMPEETVAYISIRDGLEGNACAH